MKTFKKLLQFVMLTNVILQFSRTNLTYAQTKKSRENVPAKTNAATQGSLAFVQVAPKINAHKQLSVQFVQTRETDVTRKRKLPTGQMNQKGIAFFQRKPDRFLWKVTEPEQSRKTISYNGSKLSVYFPDIDLEKIYSNTGSVGQEYQKIILMLRDPVEFLKEYEETGFKRLSASSISFQFKNKERLAETQAVSLVIDEKENFISKAELTYRGTGTAGSESGERTLRFEFSKPTFAFPEESLNPNIPKTAKSQRWD